MPEQWGDVASSQETATDGKKARGNGGHEEIIMNKKRGQGEARFLKSDRADGWRSSVLAIGL